MTWVAFVVLVSVGLAVGLAEVVTRYNRSRNFFSKCSWVYLYVGANMLAGVIVPVGLKLMGVEIAESGEARAVQVATAGASGLALVRASVFGRRLTMAPTTEGAAALSQVPTAVLGYILQQADLQVRERYNRWLDAQAKPLVAGWSFTDQSGALVTMCQRLADLSQPERVALEAALQDVAGQNLPDGAKRFMLARACIHSTSADCLRTALDQLTTA